MVLLISSSPNIADVMKSTDPNGKYAQFANLQSQTNQLDMMMPAVEANNIVSHRVTQLLKLPDTVEREINEGTLATKEEKGQHDEGIAMLDQWSVIDDTIIELSGAAYRAGRIKVGMESVAQRAAFLSIYGDQRVSRKQFTGFLPRCATIGSNCIDGGGTVDGKQTSIYLVLASTETVYYVFPKGSGTAGLAHKDFGLVAENNQGATQADPGAGAGKHMAAWKDKLSRNMGLAVEDQRCLIRIANVDSDEMTLLNGKQAPTSFESIIHKMLIALGRLPRSVSGKRFFVCDRVVQTGLQRMIMEKSTQAVSLVTATNQFGADLEVMQFMGSTPILLVDQIANNELRAIA